MQTLDPLFIRYRALADDFEIKESLLNAYNLSFEIMYPELVKDNRLVSHAVMKTDPDPNTKDYENVVYMHRDPKKRKFWIKRQWITFS